MSDRPQHPAGRPTNPARRFAWAAAWLVVAGLSGAVLVLDFDRVVGNDLQGQRTEGFLVTLPFIALAIAVALMVSAVRAIPPWQRYRSSVASVPPRGSSVQPGAIVPALIVGIVCGIVSLAGVVFVAVSFTRLAANTTGLLLAVVVISLFAMGCVLLLDVAFRARRAASVPPPTVG